MKKYSHHNLLADELSMIPDKSDWLGKMMYKFNKKGAVFLEVEVPLNTYLRAEIFCDDITELSEMPFTQNDLMGLLYNDFLLYVKKNPDPRMIFNLVSSLDEEAGKDRGLLRQEGESVFKTIYKERGGNTQLLNMRMRRKHALRGEVLLADLEEVFPNHGYTIERILALLYIDFTEKFRKGHNAEAINKILSLITEED